MSIARSCDAMGTSCGKPLYFCSDVDCLIICQLRIGKGMMLKGRETDMVIEPGKYLAQHDS